MKSISSSKEVMILGVKYTIYYINYGTPLNASRANTVSASNLTHL